MCVCVCVAGECLWLLRAAVIRGSGERSWHMVGKNSPNNGTSSSCIMNLMQLMLVVVILYGRLLLHMKMSSLVSIPDPKNQPTSSPTPVQAVMDISVRFSLVLIKNRPRPPWSVLSGTLSAMTAGASLTLSPSASKLWLQ